MRATDKVLRECIESLARETGIPFKWGHSNGFARIEEQQEGSSTRLVMDGSNRECLDWIKGFRSGWYAQRDRLKREISELLKG